MTSPSPFATCPGPGYALLPKCIVKTRGGARCSNCRARAEASTHTYTAVPPQHPGTEQAWIACGACGGRRHYHRDR